MLKQINLWFADKSEIAKESFSILVLLALVAVSPGIAHAFTPHYAFGNSHTLELKKDGTVWAWGDNRYGQLGNGTTEDSKAPVKVSGLDSVTAIAACFFQSVALKKDGTVWAWGYNGSGQLGNGSTENSATPVQVSGLNGIQAIAAGNGHIVALKKDGTVWAWGSNRSGQLGTDSKVNFLTPVQVSGVSDITAVAAGRYHSIALKKDGTVWAWGYNGSGQLGDGTTSEGSFIPVQVSGLSGVTAITAGAHHCVAQKKDMTNWAWGDTFSGIHGNGIALEGSTKPFQLRGISDVTAVTAGLTPSDY